LPVAKAGYNRRCILKVLRQFIGIPRIHFGNSEPFLVFSGKRMRRRATAGPVWLVQELGVFGQYLNVGNIVPFQCGLDRMATNVRQASIPVQDNEPSYGGHVHGPEQGSLIKHDQNDVSAMWDG
jgi:hypothetical protein